jgi:hypothetical protein
MANRRLNISLWIGQIVLAAIFLTASYVKTSTPLEQLAHDLPWTAAVPGFFVRLLGVLEGLGAVGLIVPALLRVRPVLTPLAAGGLTLLMLCAAAFHLIRGELPQVIGVLFLGMLAAGVAWGRFKDAPVPERPEHDDDLDFDLPDAGPDR